MDIYDMIAPEPVDHNEEGSRQVVNWTDKEAAVHAIEALMAGMSLEGKSVSTMQFLISLSKEDFPFQASLLGPIPSTQHLQPIHTSTTVHYVARLVQNLPPHSDHEDIILGLLHLVPCSVTNTQIIHHCLPPALVTQLLHFLAQCQVGPLAIIFKLSQALANYQCKQHKD
jgi:hypothetical protein